MCSRWTVIVLAGLGPAIHVLRYRADNDMDADPGLRSGQALPRHDDERQVFNYDSGLPENALSRRLGIPEQPAQPRQCLEVHIRVAEHLVDHRHSLEIMTDFVLHRHADTAMQLDRLLSHMPP